MANYTTNTSDKSKKKAIKLLLFGGVGLHLFYVGRVKAGIFRMVFSLLFWSLIMNGFSTGETALIVSGIGFLVAVNLLDLIKLGLGTFKDNVGDNLRA